MTNRLCPALPTTLTTRKVITMKRHYSLAILILSLLGVLGGITVGLEYLIRESMLTPDSAATVWFICLVSLGCVIFGAIVESRSYEDKN